MLAPLRCCISSPLHQLASLKAGQQRSLGRNTTLDPVRLSSLWSPSQIKAKIVPDRFYDFSANVPVSPHLSLALHSSLLYIYSLVLPVAITTLTLILAAGIFGCAVTGWIVTGINKTEPLIHGIVNTTQDSQHLITPMLSLDKYGH